MSCWSWFQAIRRAIGQIIRKHPNTSIARCWSCSDWRGDENMAGICTSPCPAHLDRRRRIDHHCAFARQNPKRREETHEQASRFRPDRARAGAGAADRAGGRRDRADAASHSAGGFRPDRERALSRAAAAKPRRHRGAAGNLHADARGSGQGRRLYGVVPRPVLGLRHDGGLSRRRCGERDLQCAARHSRLGRDRQ